MKYYGQDKEDKYLYDNFFKTTNNDHYIELGAMNGTTYSNTKIFEDELERGRWVGQVYIIIIRQDTVINY